MNDSTTDLDNRDFEDQEPTPSGELTMRLITAREDKNVHGGISGGWVASKMDMAAESIATEIAEGRVANVSMDSMNFMAPIRAGAAVCFYTHLLDIGKSSIRLNVEVWTKNPNEEELRKVVDATFVYVAIDEVGRIRHVPRTD